MGLREVRWKNLGEHLTGGHLLYYSEKFDNHTNGVGFLIHKNIKNLILGCYPISSRLMSTSLRTASPNITVVQVYAPTADHADEEMEAFHIQLQKTINRIDKRDILIIQGD